MTTRLKALLGLSLLFILGIATGVMIAPQFQSHATMRPFPADGWTESTTAEYRTRLSLKDTETTSSGSYQVDVNVAAGPEANLIVEVTFDDATTGHALVTTDLVAGAHTTVAPISSETSAEAAIYTALHADGAWDSTMSASTSARCNCRPMSRCCRPAPRCRCRRACRTRPSRPRPHPT